VKLAYLANIRLPTEKAHGLQIVQMCEAFAQTQHADRLIRVTLYAARRANTPELRTVKDVWNFYGVERAFAIQRVPCVDLYGLSRGHFERFAFAIQTLTYLIALCVIVLINRADIYYSRDPLTLLVLSLFKPRAALCYEAHQLTNSRWQTLCLRRVGTVVAVTAHLADRVRGRGAAHVIVAHDGIRAARFADMPDQAAARHMLDLPAAAFIVGYVGRLHTLGMSKGVDTLIDAIAQVAAQGAPDSLTLCIVGGPDDWAARLRQQWIDRGLDARHFIYVQSVVADRVPLYLSAFDVATMPLPWTEHFAYYASSMKLFEYMAAGRALLATDLPSTLEVVQNEHSALLTPPSDPIAMAEALRRLKADPLLRARLAAQAQADVADYTWARRAMRIIEAIAE